MDIFNQHIICFTGPRPQHLPWRFNEYNKDCILLKNKIEQYITNSINSGFDYFISGMALGFDTYCAEAVLKLKKQYPNIKLECAIPNEKQCEKWSEQAKNRYFYILEQADKVTYIDKEFSMTSIHTRNKYMVDNSDVVIAYNVGEICKGTTETINYANKKNKIVININ